MAISNFDDPNTTGYEYFRCAKKVAHHARAYCLEARIEIIKKDLPSYPQARKNKRDNFKVK